MAWTPRLRALSAAITFVVALEGTLLVAAPIALLVWLSGLIRWAPLALVLIGVCGIYAATVALMTHLSSPRVNGEHETGGFA